MDHLNPLPHTLAPRALRRPQTITVAVSPYELYVLIEALESRACHATDNPETSDVADHWFDRVAQLREAGR